MKKDPDSNLVKKINIALLKDIEHIMSKVLKVQLKPVNNRLDALEKNQKEIIKEQQSIKKTLRNHGKLISYIRSTLDTTIEYFDRQETNLNKRLNRVEDHLKLPHQM